MEGGKMVMKILVISIISYLVYLWVKMPSRRKLYQILSETGMEGRKLQLEPKSSESDLLEYRGTMGRNLLIIYKTKTENPSKVLIVNKEEIKQAQGIRFFQDWKVVYSDTE